MDFQIKNVPIRFFRDFQNYFLCLKTVITVSVDLLGTAFPNNAKNQMNNEMSKYAADKSLIRKEKLQRIV